MDITAHSPELHTYRLYHQADDSSVVAGKKGKRVILYERVTENEALRNLNVGTAHYAEIAVRLFPSETMLPPKFLDIHDFRVFYIAELLWPDGQWYGQVWSKKDSALKQVKTRYADLIASEMNRQQKFSFKVTSDMVSRAQGLKLQSRRRP